MYLNYIHINNRKHFKSGETTQIKKKTGKTTSKNCKIETKNKKIQPKRRQQSDGVISITGIKQRLWKAGEKELWAHQKLQKYQTYIISINLSNLPIQ